MVGKLMVRKIRSGTGEGPGICKKWRPATWKSSFGMGFVEAFPDLSVYFLHTNAITQQGYSLYFQKILHTK